MSESQTYSLTSTSKQPPMAFLHQTGSSSPSTPGPPHPPHPPRPPSAPAVPINQPSLLVIGASPLSPRNFPSVGLHLRPICSSPQPARDDASGASSAPTARRDTECRVRYRASSASAGGGGGGSCRPSSPGGAGRNLSEPEELADREDESHPPSSILSRAPKG